MGSYFSMCCYRFESQGKFGDYQIKMCKSYLQHRYSPNFSSALFFWWAYSQSMDQLSYQYSIDNIAVWEIQYAMLHRKIIFLNCATFLGISVSSKTDGVIVLHLPIEDRGDKVSLSILWKYWFYHHLHSSSHTEVKWFFFRFIMCNPQCLTWSSLFLVNTNPSTSM